MIRVGLIGYGYWGAILARNLAATPGVSLEAIADESPARLKLAAQLHRDAALFNSGSTLLLNDNIEAVVIATPLSRHYSLCKLAIERGKHVLVEKPMVASVVEADELVELAYKKCVSLTVDHTFIYSPAIRKIRSIIDDGGVGELLYLDSVRANFGLFRGDTNVIWDLAAHDFAILDYLFKTRPVAITANAMRLSGHQYESLAHVTIHFNDGCLSHFNLNWLAPEKVRYMVICGNRRMIVYDDLKSIDKVLVYDKNVTVERAQDKVQLQTTVYHSSETYIPTLDLREPLSSLTREFADAIEEGRQALTNGEAGARVVALLAAAERSVRSGGLRVCL